MLFDAVPTISVLGADRAVIRTLGVGITAGRETGRQIVIGIPQKVLLLEAEPEIVVVVVDGCATVGGVRRAVSVQHLAHDEIRVVTVRVGDDRTGLQQTVGIAAFGLLSGAAVERPLRTLFEGAAEVGLDAGFAAQALGRRVTVEPDVLKFRFTHVMNVSFSLDAFFCYRSVPLERCGAAISPAQSTGRVGFRSQV